MKLSDLKKDNWVKDLVQFIRASEEAPLTLQNQVLDQIYGLLNPSPLRVLLKTWVTHIFAGSFTLFFCPQFGVGKGRLMVEVFMKWGTVGCAIGCGVFFFGASLLASSLVLSYEERKVALRNGWWQWSLMGALSAFTLMLIQEVTSVDWGFVSVWLVTGVVVGYGIFLVRMNRFPFKKIG